MAFYGNENKENIITLTSFLGASEDFFVLVDKQSGTIYVYNQEWGVYYSGDRLVGTIKYNQETKSYSPMDYNDENGWRIWLNARGYEKNWFDNPVILNQVIDHAIKLSTKQNIEEGEITQDVYPQIEDILPERTKENTVEIEEVDPTDETTDDKIENNTTSPEKVENMNKDELEKERMIIAGDANNDGIADPPTEQRMAAYRQLIEDGPQGAEWDRYIAALKKLYPELESVNRISDAELEGKSYEEQWAIRARRAELRTGNSDLSKGDTLENFSKTSKLKLALADPCKNNFFESISNNLNTFLTRVTGGLNGVIGTANSVLNFSNELTSTAKAILGTSKSFISQMGDFLQAKIQTFIKMGLQKMATFLFATSFTPLDGLLKVMALNVSAINPVGMIMKVVGCLTSKVGDVLKDVVQDMLSNMVGQVVNGVTCAVEQFVGGLTNKITSVMDSIVGPFIRPVEKLFSLIGFGFGSIKGLLGKGFNIMNQIGNLLKCGSNKTKNCPTSSYIIDQGTAPQKSPNQQQSIINRTFDKGSQKLANVQDSLNDFDKGVGEWEIFGSKVKEGKNVDRCNTSANIFKCGAPKLEFIGGDGEGAVGKVLLGRVIDKFDPTNLRKDVKSVASIIGVEMEFPGEGYTKAPIVAFTDSCEQGYGAYGRAVIGQDRTKPTFGQITDVIIISEGVNYPTGDNEEVYVDKILVEDGGSGYSMDDNIDDFEICGVDENGGITSICPNNKAYRSLPQLNITSVKGNGAILRPIMTTKRRETVPQMEIDCVTT